MPLSAKTIRYLAVISIAGGILSGIASLAVSTLLPQQLHLSAALPAIALFVLIEELAKITATWSILKSFSLFRLASAAQVIMLALGVGFGFGLFEFFLILLGTNVSVNALKPMVIHLATGFSIGLAFHMFIRQKRCLALALIMLSLAIHLCYNIFVAIDLF